MKDLMRPSELELAWFAGFFDGEGSIQIVTHKIRPRSKRRRATYGLRISIGNTYLPAIVRVKKMWNIGHIIPLKSKNKPRWEWHAACNEACYILKTVLPYLLIKGHEAKVVVVFQENKRRSIKKYGTYCQPDLAFEKDKEFRELLQEMKGLNPKAEVEINGIVDRLINEKDVVILDPETRRFKVSRVISGEAVSK